MPFYKPSFVVCCRNGFISVKTLSPNMLEISLHFPPEEHSSLVSAPKGLDGHTGFILQQSRVLVEASV